MDPIQINDIGEYGLKVHDSIDHQVIGLEKEDYVHFIAPLDVHVKILKAESTILCDVAVDSRIETFCSRSLAKIERDWHVNFTVDFDIEPQQQVIDIQEDIRQEVILRLPMRVISDEEQQTNRVGKQLEEMNQTNKNFIKDQNQPEGTYRPFEGLEDI